MTYTGYNPTHMPYAETRFSPLLPDFTPKPPAGAQTKND